MVISDIDALWRPKRLPERLRFCIKSTGNKQEDQPLFCSHPALFRFMLQSLAFRLQMTHTHTHTRTHTHTHAQTQTQTHALSDLGQLEQIT